MGMSNKWMRKQKVILKNILRIGREFRSDAGLVPLGPYGHIKDL